MPAIVMGGKGQVGSALVEILESKDHDVFILDKDDEVEPPKRLKYDFLHIAIPFHSNFTQNVKNVIRRYNPTYVIVHSTVPVGTTRRLGKNAAHSAVRGQHPNLKHGIMRFTKYVGASNDLTRKAVA